VTLRPLPRAGTAAPRATIIGSNVTVAHGALVHAATIGDGCLVGMGATLLDGVVLEPGSVVAAGAVVPPGAPRRFAGTGSRDAKGSVR
jgi:carbonic anhydrase/acetyltransferase-like protein (isoleucine patch superfamily)